MIFSFEGDDIMAKNNEKEEKANYLKNELRSYNILKKWIENDSYIFDDRIAYYNKKIEEIDTELSAGNAKGIDYDYVTTTAVNEPLLTLLAEQEKYIKRRDELLELKSSDTYGFKARIKYVDDCLDKLEEKWQKDFIVDVYCNDKEIYEIEKKYNYSRAHLFRMRDILIAELIGLTTHYQ